ncbi:hypothetical protein FACS189493_6070 [Spirochaetia bacterium]|nr:hypothetical protein FACS189493_6070 [Spirochaetia bacterium]
MVIHLEWDMLYPIDDFRELTQRDVSIIAKKLNEHPRKTLAFKMPKRYSLYCARNFRVPLNEQLVRLVGIYENEKSS